MALLDHVDIKEAAVSPWKGKSGDQHLVAYLVPAEEQSPTINAIRSILTEVLPNYMIPSIYVTLAAMPLLPNGKLNRRALPPPDRQRPKLESLYAAPRTPVEVELAEIWAKVLELDQVGINDNFFDLGGHSLLATQVISRVIKSLSSKRVAQSPVSVVDSRGYGFGYHPEKG